MSESIEIIKTYQGPDASVSQCLATLEGFIGDTNEQELDDGTVLDASDAVTAINGLIWSMERCEAENERLRAALTKIADLRYSEADEPLDEAIDIADAAINGFMLIRFVALPRPD
jgi:hypothetical protein